MLTVALKRRASINDPYIQEKELGKGQRKMQFSREMEIGDVLEGIPQNFGIDDTLSMAETSQKYKKGVCKCFKT